MGRQAPFEGRHAVAVDGGEGLVEHPQRTRDQLQPGQGHPALLAGGELAGGQVLEANEPHGRQGGEARGLVIGLACEGLVPGQILERRQRCLDPRRMAQVEQIGQEVLARAPHGMVVPVELALEVRQLPGKDLQQGGLAAAVGAFHTHDLAGMDVKVKVPEQPAIIPLTGQLSGLQTQAQGTLPAWVISPGTLHGKGPGYQSSRLRPPVAVALDQALRGLSSLARFRPAAMLVKHCTN